MSRAFVKEDSDVPPPPLERAVSSAPNLVTVRGARLIEEEIASLEARIAEAPDAEEADLLRRDLRYWQTRRATAKITSANGEGAGFGTRLRIRRGGAEQEIMIVGEDEADPGAGRIAWTSPLARALDGAEPGETVELHAGGRSEPVELLSAAPIDED